MRMEDPKRLDRDQAYGFYSCFIGQNVRRLGTGSEWDGSQISAESCWRKVSTRGLWIPGNHIHKPAGPAVRYPQQPLVKTGA